MQTRLEIQLFGLHRRRQKNYGYLAYGCFIRKVRRSRDVPLSRVSDIDDVVIPSRAGIHGSAIETQILPGARWLRLYAFGGEDLAFRVKGSRINLRLQTSG